MIIKFMQCLMKSTKDEKYVIYYVKLLMRSDLVISLFHQMSFHYRSTFIENLIKLIELVNDDNFSVYGSICEELI